MTKIQTRIAHGVILTLGIAIGIGAVYPFAAARASKALKGAGSGQLLSGVQRAWREVDGRVIPPLGTPSAVAWNGLDSWGHPREVPAFNCFESVNYLTTGDSGNCSYRLWPVEALQDLEENSTWDVLEHSIKPGDVVEFVAKVQTKKGGEPTISAFHAQLCVSEGGLMAGANNEPRFHLINGVPSETNVWDVCTSRQYYLALREMDEMWSAYGNDHAYQVNVYRHPE